MLDRLAYRSLLEQLGWAPGTDSDFHGASIVAAMRLGPCCAIIIADAPTGDVIDAIGMMRRLRPEIGVLVVSAASDPLHTEAWGQCTPSGFVVKDAGAGELARVLEIVSEGGRHFTAGTAAPLARGAKLREGLSRLSRREWELLPLLARGMTLREAARVMAVRYKTADAYRSSLLKKLGVRNRVELARYAIRRRIIEA